MMAGIFSSVCYTVAKSRHTKKPERMDDYKEAHFVYTWMSKKMDRNKEAHFVYT